MAVTHVQLHKITENPAYKAAKISYSNAIVRRSKVVEQHFMKLDSIPTVTSLLQKTPVQEPWLCVDDVDYHKE